MDDLDLFGRARPEVDPLDPAQVDRIHHEVFGVSQASAGAPEPMPTITMGGRRPTERSRSGHRARLLAAAAVVVGIGIGGIVLASRSATPGHTTTSTPSAGDPGAGDQAPGTSAGAGLPVAPPPTDAPPGTFPPADQRAENFLITGADNNSCIDPDTPYAGAFGDRSSMGERSDTVMVMRLDPSTKRAAILSFPRDLWVAIPGRGEGRINTAYVKDDPQLLIDTIYQNFGVTVDHFIQIDFCAFKTIVDAIDGGVGVPFEYPTRDTHTGLNVPEPGCYFFDGDAALAYVRSRYYQYYDDGEWKSDGVSDLGRIARQQDFIRRVLDAARAQGLFDVDLARGLLDAAKNNVVVDTQLTIAKMLEVVGVLADLDAGALTGYQIEAVGRTIAGQSVLEPRIESDDMQLILSIFKGEAPLAGATATAPTPTSVSTAATAAAPDASAPPDHNVQGVVPPGGVTC